MLEPNLRVIIDGDTSQAFRGGDHVKGRVVLVLERGEKVKGLTLNFIGALDTQTTRPFYVSGNDSDARGSRRKYWEKIDLFNFEKRLLSECNLTANKHSWNFEFTFPNQTEGQFSRWAHGKTYAREPHSLPPTFQSSTSSPGGRATISYYLQAHLPWAGPRAATKATQLLGYVPRQGDLPREPVIKSRILYGQTWKPSTKNTKTTVDKIFGRVSRKQTATSNLPKIVPTLYYPETASPGQHIPLLICLARANIGEHPVCILDSLTVTLSTYTTSMCGQPLTQPEDSLSKHVTCISKQDLDQQLSFSTPTPLTTNFHLVDDAECVPTFRTYNITRRYAISITLKIKCEGQQFTVQSTTPLKIVARTSTASQLADDDEEVEQLPLYMPREPSKEFAPDYETIYSLSPTPSTAVSLAMSGVRSESFSEGQSAPSTAPTTPGLELEGPILEQRIMSGTRGLSYLEDHSAPSTAPTTPGSEFEGPILEQRTKVGTVD